jgi:peroxiredoxin (alkyl hydroperoxide reductase subunit C)
MKKDPTACRYDYANKCDCAEDDRCGCTYPNNMLHDFSEECAASKNDFLPPPPATLGNPAPDFTTPALLSDGTLIQHFNFYKYTADYNTVLFFYPEDFMFTCPSELLLLNKELNAFNQRQTKILALSTDSVYSHIAWKQLPPERDGIADISFPLLADLDKHICRTYQVLNRKETALRATFIMDKHHIIRHISLNDHKIWRYPEEYLRIIDILNQKQTDITTCPKGWKQNFPFERPEPKSLLDTITP